MPRLPPSLIREARRRHRYLPLLLRECRDLPSAQNELRWLSEHAFGLRENEDVERPKKKPTKLSQLISRGSRPWQILHRDILRRSQGEPLQYILGTQPFGDLEITCRKGVLIPRSETEAYTLKIAAAIQQIVKSKQHNGPLKILDLCTGTGCIALLLHSLLRPPSTHDISDHLEIVGVDISAGALKLAAENLQNNVTHNRLHPSAAASISFVSLDVLSLHRRLNQLAARSFRPDVRSKLSVEITSWHRIERERVIYNALYCHFREAGLKLEDVDVVISNPPYISPEQYAPGGTVARSVRTFEPKDALVPRVPPHLEPAEIADQFYQALWRIAMTMRAKCVVLEVGDNEQAERVAAMIATKMSTRCIQVLIEIWSDDDSVREWQGGDYTSKTTSTSDRAVVVWMASWKRWRLGLKLSSPPFIHLRLPQRITQRYKPDEEA